MPSSTRHASSSAPGPTGTASTSSCSPSTTASRTAICRRRSCSPPRSPGARRRSASASPPCWCRCTTRCAWPSSSPSSISRAGAARRLKGGFSPAIGDPRLAEVYRAECRRLGFDGGFVHLPSGPGFVHVSDDPARDWARIAPHALYDAQTYASWQTPGQRSSVHVEATSAEELRRSGVYRVVTPDECVGLARETGQVLLHPLMGGLPPALGWEGLERFAAQVL